MVASEVFENRTKEMKEQRIFVGNLPNSITENDLQKLFKKYGVINVEIKKRKSILDQESAFAYVNIPSKSTDNCLNELSGKKWYDHELKVEIAKENFLEKLKKERTQQLNQETNKQTTPNYLLNNHASKNRRTVFDSDDGLSDEGDSASKNDTSLVTFKRNLPMFQGISNLENVNKNTSSKLEEQVELNTSIEKLNMKKLMVNASMQKFEEFSDVWKDDISDNNFRYINKVSPMSNCMKNPEPYAKNDKKLVNHSKYIAEVKRQNALEEKWNSIKERKHTIKNALKNLMLANKCKIRPPECTNENENSTAESRKIPLFNDDSEDETFKPNFEVKPFLEGEKALKLKSKFASDDRFQLDERFLDAESDSLVESNCMKSEKATKVQQSRQIIRYDPTKSEHKVLEKKRHIDFPTSEKKKNTKKKIKKSKTEEENVKHEEARPVVSKDKHYIVSDTLKDAFKKTETKPVFKLSEIFDDQIKQNNTSVENQKQTNEAETKNIKFIKNPFQTVSDTDSEGNDDDEAPVQVLPLTVRSEKVLGKYGVWGESFFFKPDDSRLNEAAEFYKCVSESKNTDFSKQRSNLKKIVRKKIQNSRRDNKLFRQKLGGKLNKTKFKMRLKKASL